MLLVLLLRRVILDLEGAKMREKPAEAAALVRLLCSAKAEFVDVIGVQVNVDEEQHSGQLIHKGTLACNAAANATAATLGRCAACTAAARLYTRHTHTVYSATQPPKQERKPR